VTAPAASHRREPDAAWGRAAQAARYTKDNGSHRGDARMSEYPNEQVKKEAEQQALYYFLDAYESVTGETLEVLEPTERPDFICVRQNGEQVGVELAKVRRGHPNDILWDKIIEKQDFMSVEHASEMIQQVVNEKEEKRSEPDWKLPEAAILIIELRDIPLADIEGCISEAVLPDIFSNGFEEIWVADLSEQEAYDNVEVFCIRPEKWRGYHSRGIQKPYGWQKNV